MNSTGEQQALSQQTPHEPATEAAMLSQAVSLSSQPSLPSLPSLGPPSDLINVSPYCHHQCVATVRAGHSSCYVSALAVHGHSLYIASSDGRISVWPLVGYTTGSQEEHHQQKQDDNDDSCSATTVVAEYKSSVKCLLATGSSSSNDQRLLLLSSHQDGKIKAWRAGSSISSSSRKKKKKKDGYGTTTTPSRLVLRAVLPTRADRLRTCLLPWSYVQVRRHRWRTWVHHADAVTALAVSAAADGAPLLYSASWDRSVRVWRLGPRPGFRCVESIAPAHDDAVNALAVSPDGHVYTASADKKIRAWIRRRSSNRHVLVQTMERHRSAVNALALGGDGNVLYSGACDRSVVVWERVGSGGRMEATGTLRGHAKAILCLAAAGDVVCSGSADRTVRVWRRGAEKENNTGGCGYTRLAVLEGHGAPVKSLTCLVYGRDDDRGLFSGLGDAEEGEGSLSGGGGGGGRCALVCSGALDGEVKIWSVLVPSQIT